MVNQNNYKIFFSNDLEILAESLYFQLQSSSAFRKKYILLPAKNCAWKDWLMALWVKKAPHEVVCCLEWMTVKEFFSFLEQQKFCEKKELTQDQIFFLLHDIFRKLLENRNWPSYLSLLKKYLTKATVAELHQLRKTLAQLFSLYSMYGAKEEQSWLEKKHWQDALWHTIFYEKEYKTTFRLSSYKQEAAEFFSHIDIHLFGIPFLPSVYLERLSAISQNARIFQYHFSASAFYWQDMVSDRFFAKQSLEEGFLINENFSDNRHRLLVNYGELEKQCFPILDSFDLDSLDFYRKEFPDTVLGNIQHCLFSAKQEHKTVRKDDSLAVFAVFGSKLREIEALLHQVFSWKKEDASLELSDIGVFAPDITSYHTYIDLVFANSGITYHIEEEKAIANSLFLQGFLRYLSLLTSCFRKEEVLHLFSLLPVRNRFLVQQNMMEKIVKMLDATEWIFGRNEAHAAAHTAGQNKQCFQHHHWEYAKKRILLSLIMHNLQEASLSIQPVPHVSWQDKDWIEVFLRYMHFLQVDQEFVENHPDQTVAFWSSFLEEKIDQYFLVGSEDMTMKQEVQRLLQELKKAPTQEVISFVEFTLFVKERLEKKPISRAKTALSSLCFSSLQEASITPKKIIYILGMSEDVFPKSSKKHPLNRLNTYFPKESDIDRYLFLQMLFCAKKKLCFSYQKRSLSDGKENAVSSLVEILLEWIEEHFGISKHLWYKNIPIDPIHPTLFTQTGAYRNYCKHGFSMLANRQENVTSVGFTCVNKRNKLSCPTVSVRDLERFAKHPIKFFIQRHLGVYLEEKESSEKGFLLSAFDKFLWKKHLLTDGESTMAVAKQKTKTFPVGIFSLPAFTTLQKEKIDFFSSLSSANLSVDSCGCLPVAIDLTVEKNPVQIKGALEDVHPEGIWSFQAKTKKVLFSLWPKILLYLLQKQTNTCTLLFFRDGKVKKMPVIVSAPKKALEDYLSYFFLCQKEPSFFLSFWAKELLEKDSSCFLQKAAAWQQENDPYLSWAFRDFTSKDFLQIYSSWHPFASKVFAQLIEACSL